MLKKRTLKLPGSIAKRLKTCHLQQPAAKQLQGDDRQDVGRLIANHPNKILWTQEDFKQQHDDPPVINVKSSLEAFVWPMSVHEFKQHFFQRLAFANTVGSRDRVRGIVVKYLDNLNLETVLEESASVDSDHGGNEAGIFVWTRDAGTGKIQSISVEPKSALICFNAQGSSAALYFRSPQKMANEFAKSFAMALGMDFTALFNNGDVKPEIEMFVSHQGHYTDWHTDFQENFTIQLKGSKKWKVAKGAVKSPLRGCTPHYFDNQGVKETQMKAHALCVPEGEGMCVPQEWEEVVLGEGDVLYHPAGLWHAVETLEESVSMNVSLIGTTWADLVSDGVKQLLWKDSNSRSIITFPQTANGEIDVSGAREQASAALESLKKVVNSLRPEDLLPIHIFKRPTNADGGPPLFETSRVRWNPLCVMFKKSDMSVLSLDDAEEAEGVASDKSSITYVLHFNFGNENMEAQSRVELSCSEQEMKVVEVLKQLVARHAEGVVSVSDICFHHDTSVALSVLTKLLRLGVLQIE
eukprot:TRINITY_DN5802_c1_g1_i1.p1 TRINITY_DN5802_c1_g1~~TRINITY_DN5802_c1_g1_i1.p1  ORF type:complete len:524 (-),score=134.93 TRINITY_DN5802_c1_g1_i1:33-1604(-)